MNWLRHNKFLGAFSIALALATIGTLFFLLHEKALTDDQQTRLEATVNELNRLRNSQLFPNEENFQKARAQLDVYRSSLGDLEKELQSRTLPIVALEPNEFQAQLRQTENEFIEHANLAKVRIPANFHLGFDEYTSSLPNLTAAPLLSRELKAIQMLLNSILDAHVDVLTSFKRTPLPEEKSGEPSPSPRKRGARAPAGGPPAPVTTQSLEVAFSAGPSAMRKALNQVATAKDQLFIVRVLNVRNQVDKGPKRETSIAPAAPPAEAVASAPTPTPAAVHFIVGTEHIDVNARIEIVNFTAPEKELR